MSETSKEAVEHLAKDCRGASLALKEGKLFTTAQSILRCAANRLDTLVAERDAALAEAEKFRGLYQDAIAACEERADVLDEMGLEVECCVATAKNCASDIEALHPEGGE